MKKNYIIYKQIVVAVLLLLSVHFTTNAQSRSNRSKQVSRNVINQEDAIVSTQKPNVTPSVLAVCDINQNSFNVANSFGDTTFGQSFTAQCNSNIASVSLTIGSTIPATPITVAIYLGETISGVSLGNATINSGISGENIFTFSSPIPITSGQVYSFIATSSNFTVPFSNTDPYTDGNAADNSGFLPGLDLVFKVTTCDTAITPTFTAVTAICIGETRS